MLKKVNTIFFTLLLVFTLSINVFAFDSHIDSYINETNGYQIVNQTEFEQQLFEQGYKLVFSEEVEVRDKESRFIDFNIGFWSISINAYSDGAGLYRWTATPHLYQVGTTTLDYACADTTMISFSGRVARGIDPRWNLHVATEFYTVTLPYIGPDCYISMNLDIIEDGITTHDFFTKTYNIN